MVNKYFLPLGGWENNFSPPWKGGESTFPTLGRWGINLT